MLGSCVWNRHARRAAFLGHEQHATILVESLSIDATQATGVVKEAMIYTNVIGCNHNS